MFQFLRAAPAGTPGHAKHTSSWRHPCASVALTFGLVLAAACVADDAIGLGVSSVRGCCDGGGGGGGDEGLGIACARLDAWGGAIGGYCVALASLKVWSVGLPLACYEVYLRGAREIRFDRAPARARPKRQHRRVVFFPSRVPASHLERRRVAPRVAS